LSLGFSRLRKIGEPFSENLRQASPPPLMRALALSVYVDEIFWRDTLRCPEEEFQEIRQSAALRNDDCRESQ
jgi:hypothetical protein